MKIKKFKTLYKIGNKTYSFKYSGKSFFGKNKILLKSQDNLLKKTKFDKNGYGIIKINKYIKYTHIKSLIYKIIKKYVQIYTKNKLKKFKLENYHTYVDSISHYKIIKKLSKGISFQNKFMRKDLEKFLSKILLINVSTLNNNFQNKKHKYYINPNKFYLRIARPLQNDFNPPHKDEYFDNHANAINIYIPIAGSNYKSSLPIFPKSQFINEKNILRTKLNSNFNNLKFSVPLILKTKPQLKLIRPNPKKGYMMIFSSNIIHGGGINENKNITRISIELRFWRT
jgi:hypothetical protein